MVQELNLTGYYSLKNMQSHILKYCSCRDADLEIWLLESSGVLSENYFDIVYPANLDVKFPIAGSLRRRGVSECCC